MIETYGRHSNVGSMPTRVSLFSHLDLSQKTLQTNTGQHRMSPQEEDAYGSTQLVSDPANQLQLSVSVLTRINEPSVIRLHSSNPPFMVDIKASAFATAPSKYQFGESIFDNPHERGHENHRMPESAEE